MSGVPRRILVVEDHPTLRQAILLVLRDAGMVVEEAAQGDAALAALRRERPDAILLDMNIPGASGAEVLTALRADPATAGIPVIVMTATGDEGRAAAMATAMSTCPPTAS